MAWHELIAACLSASAVWLTTRRSPWCFPVGLASISVYLWVFAEARLYSDVLLQCCFAAMLVSGWWRWLHHLDASGHVRIAPLDPKLACLHLLAGLGLGLLLGYFMHRHTHAALPWLDALLTAFSLVGQLWQNRRHIAAWGMWIAVDLVYVGMYLHKDLTITALLYTGFIGLAIKGWHDWRKARDYRLAPS